MVLGPKLIFKIGHLVNGFMATEFFGKYDTVFFFADQEPNYNCPIKTQLLFVFSPKFTNMSPYFAFKTMGSS